jgi:hypothetical protein
MASKVRPRAPLGKRRKQPGRGAEAVVSGPLCSAAAPYSAAGEAGASAMTITGFIWRSSSIDR